jgi:hypothetical protein
MQVQDLIFELSQLEPTAEVRVAYQPSYPLAAEIAAVTDLVESSEEGFVWIATSSGVGYSESPYAPRDAWDGS